MQSVGADRHPAQLSCSKGGGGRRFQLRLYSKCKQHTATGSGHYSSRLILSLCVHYSRLSQAKPQSAKPQPAKLVKLKVFKTVTTVAGVLDEPFSHLTLLRRVAVQARQAGTVSTLCSLAGRYGYSAPAELAQLSYKVRLKLPLQVHREQELCTGQVKSSLYFIF